MTHIFCEKFIKNELDRAYGLVCMSQASMYTIEKILNLLKLFTNNIVLKEKIKNILDILDSIKNYIENSKIY